MEDIKTVMLLVVSSILVLCITVMMMFMTIASDLRDVVQIQKQEICELGGACDE